MAISIWRHIGNSLADGIEKHTVGVIGMFSSIAFITYLLIKEGGSATVESLITTLMIVSAALMGITSIAGSISTSHSKTRSETISYSESKSSSGAGSSSSNKNNSSSRVDFERREEYDGC